MKADVQPKDIYYDLKIHYREQSIGTLPKTGATPTQLNDANLKTYLTNYPNSGALCSSLSGQEKYKCILQKELGAIKIPKDETIDITFPTVIEAGSQKPVAYTQFNYAWEAGETGEYDTAYGVEAIQMFGGEQSRTVSLVDSQGKHDIAGLIAYGAPSNSIPLQSHGKTEAGGELATFTPERVRLRAIGHEIWLLGWGYSPSSPSLSTMKLRLDSGVTTIESIGQYGHTERRLTATINRADKRIINIADFTLFTSAANICVAAGCN